MANQATSQTQTARQAAVAVDARNASFLKGFIVKESASSELVGRFKLTDDPKLAAVQDAMPPQSQTMNREMAQGLNDKGIVTIDAERASEIEEACVKKSSVNNVIGTYLPLCLGAEWGKGRGSQKLRKAMGGNSFTVWTRV